MPAKRDRYGWFDPWVHQRKKTGERVLLLGAKFTMHRPSGDITAPEGFDFDGASAPRPFWWIIDPFGEYAEAALIHDWEYRQQYRPRRECDAIFLDGMRILNTPLWKRWIMWAVVRLFGWIAWRANRKRGSFRRR